MRLLHCRMVLSVNVTCQHMSMKKMMGCKTKNYEMTCTEVRLNNTPEMELCLGASVPVKVEHINAYLFSETNRIN